MRRVDRILFSALGQGDKEKTEFSNGSSSEEFSATKMPVAATEKINIPTPGLHKPEPSSELETDASKDTKKKDAGLEAIGNVLCSPALPAISTNNESLVSDTESPAPLVPPRTPNVLASITIGDTSIVSPPAPAFSPLTPLITRNYAINNSPLPPMSPSTLALFETLSRDFSTVEQECNDNSKIPQDDGISCGDPNQVEDFDNDTDSEYVPDSGEETDNSGIYIQHKKRKGFQVPESNSSEDDIEQEALVHTHIAMVHDDHSRPDGKSQMHHNKSPFTTHINNSKITVDEIISMCHGSDTEKNNPEAELVPTEAETESIPAVTELINAPQATGRPKRGRKRKHPEYNLSEKKNRKYLNLPYHSKDKLIKSKVFSDYACTCKQRCFMLVSTEKRKEEFEKFVTLGSYEAQLLYILNNVTESEKARSYVSKKTKSGKNKPRQFARHYYICGKVVCKEMFLKNFQISSKKVDICLAKQRTQKTYKDKRGEKQGGWNKTPQEDIDFVKNLINSLPKYKSYYRRESNNGTEYLKVGMTVQKIYDIYVSEFKKIYGDDKKYVSFATLKRIFYTNFNLRCKLLKKDTCKTCDSLVLQINKCHVSEEKDLLIKKRDTHQMRAQELRNKMSEDLARAKIDPKFECITYDLEKTLPLPRIPTNIVFYKRQLWVYNAGIHVGSSDQGRCNIWVEGEAGRGAQEVGSCLINFIKNHLRDGVENLVLWSDSCGGQNRNIKIVLMLKTVLNSHSSLKTITFKYLESGHSFLPNDTDFSKIECELKNHERVYTVEEYMNIMKIAKKKNPLHVTRMKSQDFLSSKKIEKKVVNRKICTNKNKINWLNTKQIILKKDDPYLITMISNSGEIQILDVSKKIKGILSKFSEEDFEVLWPQGKAIAEAKLADLKSMYNLIPEDCHAFYNNLTGTDINEDVDGYGPALDFDLEEE